MHLESWGTDLGTAGTGKAVLAPLHAHFSHAEVHVIHVVHVFLSHVVLLQAMCMVPCLTPGA